MSHANKWWLDVPGKGCRRQASRMDWDGISLAASGLVIVLVAVYVIAAADMKPEIADTGRLIGVRDF